MISKISVDSNSKINSLEARKNKNRTHESSPNFKGLGGVVLSGIQACERMPMVNVAVIDMLSAILPRTIVESMTNWFAGFEAFRRESSGLVVNCLIPSLIAYGLAKCFNPSIMPKGTNMSGCWADSSLINKATEYYKNSNSDDKVVDSLKQILGNIEGYESKNKILLKENGLTTAEIEKYAQQLAEISRYKDTNKPFNEQVSQWFKTTFGNAKKETNPIDEIVKSIVEKTRVAENIKISDGKKSVKASSVETLLKDSVKFFKEYQKVEGKVSIEEFANNSKKLVRTKSLAGLAIILPLAISMQYINRWITGKVSGVKGAPIYDDFGKGDSIEERPDAKEGLLKQKIISISSMIGVSLLSMMKKPTMGMLEFKGMFPTMDQARIISTATFASRMAAADDKNELAESTVRDIATFSGLYFLGDYAAKGAATIIQNKTGVSLLNDTKPLKKDAKLIQKIVHWAKDINIKSSEEVISKTEEALKSKGLKANEDQLKTITNELKHARNLRSYCQLANIGVSLALLGFVIPIFTRSNTKKKHEQALKLAQEKSYTQTEKQEQPESVTPLNVEYSKLTTGFRGDKN